jgi:tyrosyl-tRNA synthetase
LCKSKGEARRIISQGGAYVNERRLAEFDEKISLQDFGDREIVYLRRGRKHQAIVRMI